MASLSRGIDVDIRKLQEVVSDLEAEAARCLSVASELKELIKRASPTGRSEKPAQGSFLPPPPNALNGDSAVGVAVEVLRGEQRPLHIKELLPLVNAKRSHQSSRASLESGLTRALGSPKWKGILKRPAPSTFAVQ